MTPIQRTKTYEPNVTQDLPLQPIQLISIVDFTHRLPVRVPVRRIQVGQSEKEEFVQDHAE
jgi:hypothetical protein